VVSLSNHNNMPFDKLRVSGIGWSDNNAHYRN
jgi:hypothetical protein